MSKTFAIKSINATAIIDQAPISGKWYAGYESMQDTDGEWFDYAGEIAQWNDDEFIDEEGEIVNMNGYDYLVEQH